MQHISATLGFNETLVDFVINRYGYIDAIDDILDKNSSKNLSPNYRNQEITIIDDKNVVISDHIRNYKCDSTGLITLAEFEILGNDFLDFLNRF